MGKKVLQYLIMIASKQFSDDYLNYISVLISQLDRGNISQFVDHVLGVRDNKQTIFFLGNGGSASKIDFL